MSYRNGTQTVKDPIQNKDPKLIWIPKKKSILASGNRDSSWNQLEDKMGQFMGSFNARDVDLYMNDKPTFDPQAGFDFPRKEREMIAREADLISARIPPAYRDYCAHKLLEYHECRYKNMPLIYKCAHEKHDYLNCQHEDYVIRMKEFERERRLRVREQRLAGAA